MKSSGGNVRSMGVSPASTAAGSSDPWYTRGAAHPVAPPAGLKGAAELAALRAAVAPLPSQVVAAGSGPIDDQSADLRVVDDDAASFAVG